MSFVSPRVVEVRAWGHTVGAVAPDPESDAYLFEYAPEWIERGVQLAPIHMPARPGVFRFAGLSRETFYGLPPLLADALPDRFGNALIDSWMAARGLDPQRVTALDRLVYVADRAMGALTFHPPADVPPAELTAIALADLVATARRALRGEFGADPEARAAIEQLVAVGTSAGGARAKAVIAYHPETSQIRSGQLDAPEGFEHWLIKLDGVDVDPGYGIIEYAYHLMATASGIEMTECRLLPEGPRTHFLTRRFDRFGSAGRHHLSSLCGIAHLDFNLAGASGYEQYLATIQALGLPAAAREEAFRRIVFNLAAVNRDDHTKNLAFLLPDGGPWQLAPAFDVTYAYNPQGRWTSAHQMTVAGKRDQITLGDIIELGDRFAVPGISEVIDQVRRAVDRWDEFAAAAGLDESRTAAIASAHRTVGLFSQK